MRARALYAHHLTPDMIAVSFKDYYIGFPSLHTALPIIGLWFIRPWKRLARPLSFLYVTLLLPAIILLGWHFLMDIAGGIATAFLAIFITHYISKATLKDDPLGGDPTRRFASPRRPRPLAQTD